jgi:hypothetical protein
VDEFRMSRGDAMTGRARKRISHIRSIAGANGTIDRQYDDLVKKQRRDFLEQPNVIALAPHTKRCI